MFPFMALGSAGPAPKIVYRSQASTSSSTTITKPAGIAVGDVVIVVTLCLGSTLTALTTTSGSSWTQGFASDATPAFYVIEYKILNATDVSNTWTTGQNRIGYAVAYQGNGASAVAIKQGLDDLSNTGSTCVLTPYLPSALSRAMLTALIDNNNTAPTAPARTTSRVSATLGSRGYGFAEDLYYGDGPITWTVGTGSGQVAWSLEIT